MAVSLSKKIKTIAKLIQEPAILSALISFRHSGYLVETGWLSSFKNKQPLDADLNPIPWMTHSFISFIDAKLHNKMEIFEYGSGNSTLYFSKKVKSVTAAEHNMEWINKLQQSLPSNASLVYSEYPSPEYSLSAVKTGKKYDIIVDDAMDRVNVIINSLAALKEDGVIILDDSERNEYTEASEYLKKCNYKRIDFWGMAPGVLFNKCTSIFYRKENCIGI